MAFNKDARYSQCEAQQRSSRIGSGFLQRRGEICSEPCDYVHGGLTYCRISQREFRLDRPAET